jgi:ssDNA-binding Zn-finger/Zn-ribbon topoisomerase 1
MENIIPNCSKCDTPLVKKAGKKGFMYVCPNWKKDGSGCEGEIWFPPKEKEKPQEDPVLKGLREIYSKLTEIQTEQKGFYKIFCDKQDDHNL